MSVEKVDLYDLILVKSTAKAYLVRNENDEEFWIPMSQVDYIDLGRNYDDEDGNHLCEIDKISIPNWIAEEKGLI